ncbi:MAG: hypothetical protein FWD57_15110, partial [Polyangiaceae bacterium]|nr:hypothetical protein [Polyangiaceae bacterium]
DNSQGGSGNEVGNSVDTDPADTDGGVKSCGCSTPGQNTSTHAWIISAIALACIFTRKRN